MENEHSALAEFGSLGCDPVPFREPRGQRSACRDENESRRKRERGAKIMRGMDKGRESDVFRVRRWEPAPSRERDMAKIQERHK